MLAQQQDTLEEEELDQSSLQTFEKMYMQDDLATLNESYHQTTVIHREITEQMDSLEISVRCSKIIECETDKIHTKSNSEDPQYECNEDELQAQSEYIDQMCFNDDMREEEDLYTPQQKFQMQVLE